MAQQVAQRPDKLLQQLNGLDLSDAVRTHIDAAFAPDVFARLLTAPTLGRTDDFAQTQSRVHRAMVDILTNPHRDPRQRYRPLEKLHKKRSCVTNYAVMHAKKRPSQAAIDIENALAQFEHLAHHVMQVTTHALYCTYEKKRRNDPRFISDVCNCAALGLLGPNSPFKAG